MIASEVRRTLGSFRLQKIPTVVLHGGRDELIDPEQGAALAAAIPGAVFVPIAHHWHNDVLWNEPEALDALNAILDARR